MMQSRKKSILVVTAEGEAYAGILSCLGDKYHVEQAPDRSQCLTMFQVRRYEFVFIDIAFLLPEDSGRWDATRYKTELAPFQKAFHSAAIVVITPQEAIREAVQVVKAGAASYIFFPINPEEVRHVTESIYEDHRRQSELTYLRDQFWDKDSLEVVRTNNAVMKGVFDRVRSVAATKTTVILYGETGTGKGVIARLIHSHSDRRSNQFISVHCGAIPDTLVESELFGHEKGAFTGAVRRKLGKFEIATGGTIFLDEIGTISHSAQVKLLQVLQDRTFQRVGGDDLLESDARVIAATNMDLKTATESGEFRKDLYYRLNVFPIEIPPLSARREDLPILVDIFLKRLNLYYSKEIQGIHPLVLEAFENYHWPGNIRELENLIERAYIIEQGSILMPESFPGEIFRYDSPMVQVRFNSTLPLAEVRRRGIENIEREYLREVLARNKGRINLSASDAGISTRQLNKLMTRYGIRKEDFKP